MLLVCQINFYTQKGILTYVDSFCKIGSHWLICRQCSPEIRLCWSRASLLADVQKAHLCIILGTFTPNQTDGQSKTEQDQLECFNKSTCLNFLPTTGWPGSTLATHGILSSRKSVGNRVTKRYSPVFGKKFIDKKNTAEHLGYTIKSEHGKTYESQQLWEQRIWITKKMNR